MLFNYHYVNNSIEKFQEYLDHLVKEVWCNAVGPFSLDLLHPELRLIVEAIYNDDSIVKDHLDGPIKRIYEIFRTQLSAQQRQQVSKWYDFNNDIEGLCACLPEKRPATYADIRAISADLETALKDFCRSLFSDILGLKAVASRIGDIGAHYEAFVKQNSKGKCPYCGYGDIKGPHHTKRDAYDHFLPKAIYPFNSVNFRNLAPMCHECNSTYKLAKDPIRDGGGFPRKAFYSYATSGTNIKVTVILKTTDITKLDPKDLELHITAPGYKEEIESWKDVFGIEERYMAKLCAENDGMAWVEQIIEEAENGGMTADELLAQVLRAAERSPYDGANFLKASFLTACRKANIF